MCASTANARVLPGAFTPSSTSTAALESIAPHAQRKSGRETVASALLTELQETPDGTSPLPDELMVKSQYRRYSNLVYGIDTFRGLFNDRQLYVLGLLCEAVRAAHEEMLVGGTEKQHAVAVATYLGLCVDRIADRNSSFSAWDTSMEAIRNTFPQQAIRMVWDYAEVYPFSEGPGSWDGAVQWIATAIRHCSTTGTDAAAVLRGDAQALNCSEASFNTVIVDPPYYDAIQYGDLSDFFYVWLKRSIGYLYPSVFGTPLTPKQQEIIESRADKKSREYISHDEFEHRLQRAERDGPGRQAPRHRRYRVCTH